jgi:hypothetical protein
MIRRAVKAAGKDSLLNEFIPVPAALSSTTEGSSSDPVEQEKITAAREHNVSTYGYASWYDFSIAEWGTKWDVSTSGRDYKIEKIDDSHTVTLYFDTAWSPPTAAYEKLMDLGFEVEAYYYEPGMAFVGKWSNGDDEYFEYGGQDSATVREYIGEELDDYFGISEQMAEMEEENE